MRGQREHAGMITMAPAFLTCTPQNNFIGHSEGKRWNRNFAGIGENTDTILVYFIQMLVYSYNSYTFGNGQDGNKKSW